MCLAALSPVRQRHSLALASDVAGAAMRAAVIHRYGGPDVLAVEEWPVPAVGPRDVLIDVRAASLNPIDFKLRERKVWPILRPSFP